MARVTVEDCIAQVPGRFSLVLLVAKRAKQVIRGSDLTVPTKGNKVIVSALREVAAGNVLFSHDPADGSPEDQIEADLNK